MCVPLAGVGLGISLLGSAASFATQSAAASSQQSFQNELGQRNAELARANAQNQFGAINDRVIQEAQAQGAAAEDLTRESLQARGRIQAAAAEAGVSGGAVDLVLADFARQEGEFLRRSALNTEFTRRQAESDLEGVNIGLNSQLLASTPSNIQGPDLLGASVNAFSGAFSSALTLDRVAQQTGRSTLIL